jgi:hypothetical protein
VNLHDILIQGLIEEHGATIGVRHARGWHGAKSAMIERLLASEEDTEEAVEEIKTIQIRPDAFRVDEDRHVFVFYEVGVSHPLTEEQEKRYAQLWWVFDSDDYGWDVELVTVDRNGALAQVDLVRSHYRIVHGFARGGIVIGSRP